MADQDTALAALAANLGIGEYKRHVLLCTGPKCCSEQEGLEAWEALKKELKDGGLLEGENACYRTKVGCLRVCLNGPIGLVYPEGTWYQGLNVEKIPQFVQRHLVEGEPVEQWIFARNRLPPDDDAEETA